MVYKYEKKIFKDHIYLYEDTVSTKNFFLNQL